MVAAVSRVIRASGTWQLTPQDSWLICGELDTAPPAEHSQEPEGELDEELGREPVEAAKGQGRTSRTCEQPSREPCFLGDKGAGPGRCS